jgi:hypothetical protein
MAFNHEREQIGLPVLRENWEYSQVFGAMADVYINPTRKKDIPYYFKKGISFNEDTILWEQDEYVGLKVHATIDGHSIDMLYITYRFVADEDKDAGWYYSFHTASEKTSSFTSETFYSNDVIKVTKEVADSILISWGLEHK